MTSMSGTLQRTVLGRPSEFDKKKSQVFGQTNDTHSVGGFSDYTDSNAPTEEPNIYERIQQKRAKKQAASKKRVHFSKQIAESRQERALARYEKMRKEWGRIQTQLSETSGKSARHLIMERSAGDHRQKLEESHIMDASIPVENRGGAERWEMSLRKSRPSDVGVKMVRVGGLWPYPLYCPVKDKTTRQMETIRQTVVSNNDPSASERKSVLGVRTMANPYVKKNYKKYIETYIDHDPEPHMNDLQVIGINYVSFHEEQSRQFSQSKPWLDSYEQTAPPQDNASQDFPLADESDLQSEFDHTEAAERVQGPAYSLSTNQLLYFVQASGQLAHRDVVITNNGSCALQFRFEKKESQNPTQEERAKDRFHFTSKQTGILLPGLSKTFSFTFSSTKEGVFTEDWEFHTVPYHCDPAIIQLQGTLVIEKSLDAIHQLNETTQARVQQAQMQHTVHGLFDTMPHPPPPLDESEAIGIAYRQQCLSLFKKQNEHYAPVQFINDAFLHFIEQFATSLGVTSWDYALQTLQAAVQQASEDIKGEAMRTYDDIFYLVTTHFESTTWLYEEDNTFLPRLFYGRAKRIMDASLDTLMEQCDLIEEQYNKKDDDSASSKKGKKPDKKKAAPPTLTPEEEALLVEKEKVKRQQRSDHQRQQQGQEVVGNMMHNIISLWSDAEARFKVTTTPEAEEEAEGELLHDDDQDDLPIMENEAIEEEED